MILDEFSWDSGPGLFVSSDFYLFWEVGHDFAKAGN